MSSDSSSSYCSTCSESHYDSSLSITSLDDEDIDYTNYTTEDSNNELFYLKLIKDKTPDDGQSQQTDQWPNMETRSGLNYNDR